MRNDRKKIMKKNNQKTRTVIFGILLSGMLAVSMVFPVLADVLPAEDPGWTVTLNKAGKMESNFSSGQINQTVSGMQPGDEAVIKITVNNEYNDTIDWYMENEVLKSLEDKSANKGTTGGGYTYKLTYTAPDGTVKTLFDSDTVGGDTVGPAGAGLNEATNSLKNWFLLDQMKAGTKGLVELRVLLDGETQGNNYQDTVADLKLNFAVEFPATKEVKSNVKTGDTNNLLVYVIIMIVAAVLILFLVTLYTRRRKEEKERRAER